MVQIVTTEGTSDVAPPPDLASLMLTAMSLGAATSHVSQTTRREYAEGNPDSPTIHTSYCVTFRFYTPSVPSRYADLDLLANERVPPSSPSSAYSFVRPSSPISIGSTEYEDGCRSAKNLTYAPVAENPCATIAGQQFPATAVSARAAAIAAVYNARAPATTAAVGNTHAPATTAAVGNTHTPATTTAVDNTRAPVATATVTSVAAPLASGSQQSVASDHSTSTSQKWYCVTIGREVGVFQGLENVTDLVTGVSGACYVRHPSRASAQAAFDRASAKGKAEVRI